MTTLRGILHGEDEKVLDECYKDLYNSSTLFKRLVDKDSTLTPDDINEIRSVFKNTYPDKNFEEFLLENDINIDDPCIGESIYDTSLKKMCLPHIYSPVNRKQTNNFNMQEFLREAISNNQTYYLNFDLDPDFDIDNDDDFEERNKQLILADQALKSIGTIALCLNKQRKEIPYTLMDVKAENFVN